MKSGQFLLIFAAMLGCSPALPTPAAAQTCIAGGCHQALVETRNSHQPAAAGDCLFCHRQKSAEHAQDSDTSFHLTFSGNRLCQQCHEDAAAVHASVAGIECLSCHDPHGSDAPSLLKEEIPVLCFQCHPKTHSAAKARTKHAALYRPQSCATCHTGHDSVFPALLLRPERELCLACHGHDTYTRSKPLRNIARELAERPYAHVPAADSQCSVCHDPHGSNNYRLLQKPYPQGPYAPYRKGSYDLCFQCHEPALLDKASTTTGFRQGRRNLHHLHVASPSKGRVCTTCHAAHASNNPRLLNDSSRFGDWEIPINFQEFSTGGSCAPGCHQPVHYDRNVP